MGALGALVGLAAPASAAELRVSDHADRAGAQPLEGATLRDTVHIFLDADPTSTGAVFWIDDRHRTGKPWRVERTAPYDLAGTRSDGTAAGVDLRTWRPGEHVVTAAVRSRHGTWKLVHASFHVADHAELRMSLFSDRRAPVELESATVKGDLYVFTAPLPGVRRVTFYLDDEQAPLKVEAAAPWDLMGTGADGRAAAFDTRTLPDGAHTLTAVVERTKGFSTHVSADFTVANDVPDVRPVQVQVGHVEGSDAQIAIADFGDYVRIYTCGGPESLALTRWFPRTSLGERDGSGASPFAALDDLLSVEGVFGETASNGTLTHAETGEVWRWQAHRPDDQDDFAGLYEVHYGPWHFGLIVHPEDPWGKRDTQGAGVHPLGLVGQVTPVLETVTELPIPVDIDILTDLVRVDMSPLSALPEPLLEEPGDL